MLTKHAKSPYWYYSFMIDGRSYFKSTKTTNKALAQKIENEARKAIIEGTHFEKKETVSLGDIIAEYQSSRIGSGREKSDAVYARKLLGSKMCPRTRKLSDVFGFDFDKPFHTLQTKDLYRLWNARKTEGISPSTFIHELLFISGLYETAKNFGYQLPDIDIKKFKADMKIKPSKGKLVYLSIDDEAKLLHELHPDTVVKGLAHPEDLAPPARRARQDTYDLAVLLLDTGARHSEISELEWDRVWFERNQILITRTKVGNQSAVPMTDRVRKILLRRLGDAENSTYVFENKSRDGVRNYSPVAFKAAVKRAGLTGITFHTLRHTSASRLAQAGVPLQDISCLLGHSNITTTQRYAHLMPSHSLSMCIDVLNRS